MPNPSAGSSGSPVRAVSSSAGRGGAGCVTAFFAVFLLSGLACLGFFVLPALRIVSALSWRETPCTILESKVVTHSGGDDDTYSVGVRYAYVVDGRELQSDRYQFLGGSSSGYDGKAAVVRALPPGTRTVCYVNPEDPTQAVLDRGMSLEYLFALIPLFFVAVGGGGIYLVLGAGRRAAATRAAAQAWLPEAAGEPDAAGGRFRAEEAGPVTLKPSHTPLGRFAGILCAALFWNGIVGVAGWKMLSDWRASGSYDGCAVVFVGFFALIGLLLLIGVPYQLLALANPRPRLTLSRGSLPVGATAQLEWGFTGLPGRIRSLRITVEGSEEARYRRGTHTYTDRETFATLEVVATDLPSRIPMGVAAFAIPPGSMHSFSSAHNKVAWTLKLHGEVRWWPDVDEEFELRVLPPEAGA